MTGANSMVSNLADHPKQKNKMEVLLCVYDAVGQTTKNGHGTGGQGYQSMKQKF